MCIKWKSLIHSRCARSAVLVLGAKKFLHVLFHVNVTDMPEHGIGHVITF